MTERQPDNGDKSVGSRHGPSSDEPMVTHFVGDRCEGGHTSDTSGDAAKSIARDRDTDSSGSGQMMSRRGVESSIAVKARVAALIPILRKTGNSDIQILLDALAESEKERLLMCDVIAAAREWHKAETKTVCTCSLGLALSTLDAKDVNDGDEHRRTMRVEGSPRALDAKEK